MQYRPFGKDKRDVSILGFGCMRLPTTDGKPTGPVDEPEAIRIIRRGIDAGINYVDTAKVYHDGKGEAVVGKALADGYRNKVMVATKLPLWGVTNVAQCDRLLNEQLTDLRTDSIDVYLFHCIQTYIWDTIKKLDLISWAEQKKKEGKIRRIGFSFHDNIELFREVVDAFDWEFCMIQYNYFGETIQAGKEGLKYAASRGISVGVMEPLFGGTLAAPQGTLGQMIADVQANPVDLALRWVWDQPEVAFLLSGMSNMSQVEQNLEIANRSTTGCLTPQERVLIQQLQNENDRLSPIKCSKCRYCLPCPSQVDIPLNFDLYNNAVALPQTKDFQKNFYTLIAPEIRAGHCSGCGLCEEKCPQKLPIRNLLTQTHSFMS